MKTLKRASNASVTGREYLTNHERVALMGRGGTRDMANKHALALQTQLGLPLVPFAIDTFARVVFIWNKVHWYELPDPVMLLATYAFFCLGSMFLVSPERLPPSDDEFKMSYEIARRNLLLHALLFISLAACTSFFRAIDEAYPVAGIYENHAPLVLSICSLLLIASFIRIRSTELTYVNGG